MHSADGNEERKNGALNVVDVSIFSSFEKIEPCQSDLSGLLTTSPILEVFSED